MGTQRFGMHFGGGQGASIGGQNVGMRFGNGQGARIGGSSYGMQFGGRQGSQIGNFSTTPTVNPGTYYYGDVRNPRYARQQTYTMQPNYYAQQPAYIQRPNYAQQPNFVQQPNYARYPQSVLLQPNTHQPNYVQNGQQYQPQVATAQTNPQSLTGSTDVVVSTSGLEDKIELKFPAEASSALTYQLNGSELTLEPGKSVYMAADQKWNLQFSGGEGFEDREAVLSEAGSFVFSNTADEGWILLRDDSAATNVAAETTPNDQATVVMAPDEPLEIESPSEPVVPEITPPITPDENSDKGLNDIEGGNIEGQSIEGQKDQQETPDSDPIEIPEESTNGGLPEAAIEGLNLEGSGEAVIEEAAEGILESGSKR